MRSSPEALGALAALWLANHAIGEASDYDLGLYHLGIIEYAEHYATIPGLANLQTRLAASDPHLLLAAFLDRGPWAGAGWHLVDGLLVSLLALELATRLARPAPALPSFTRRVAWLLIPATMVVVGSAVDYRLASPNLDLACFVLVAVGMLYLADCVENGVRATAAVTSVATLAAASATRPLFWLSTAAAAGILVAAGPRPRADARRVLALCGLPAVLLVGWMTRQAILSGYPLYPVKVGALPVDWRVPASVVDYTGRWTSSWARWPGQGPDTVLSSWHWLRAYWLSAQEKSLDVIAPLALLACLLPAFAARGDGRASRRALRNPMLAVAVPSLVTLLIWFFEAPDPRFVLAPLWLLPISLAAWAVPPLGRPSPLLFVAGLGLGIGLAAVELHVTAWYLPAALLFPLYLLGALWVIRRPGLRPALAGAVLVATAVAGAAVAALPSAAEAGLGQLRRPVRDRRRGSAAARDDHNGGRTPPTSALLGGDGQRPVLRGARVHRRALRPRAARRSLAAALPGRGHRLGLQRAGPARSMTGPSARWEQERGTVGELTARTVPVGRD